MSSRSALERVADVLARESQREEKYRLEDGTPTLRRSYIADLTTIIDREFTKTQSVKFWARYGAHQVSIRAGLTHGPGCQCAACAIIRENGIR